MMDLYQGQSLLVMLRSVLMNPVIIKIAVDEIMLTLGGRCRRKRDVLVGKTED